MDLPSQSLPREVSLQEGWRVLAPQRSSVGGPWGQGRALDTGWTPSTIGRHLGRHPLTHGKYENLLKIYQTSCNPDILAQQGVGAPVTGKGEVLI